MNNFQYFEESSLEESFVYKTFNNINNVAYQEYSGLYDYGDGSVKYPMASRNFVVGMEYSF